jgi:hypothetical protein
MKKIIVLMLVTILALSTPAFAIKTVLNAIPDQYYVPLAVGAAAQVILQNSGTGKMESIYVVAGLFIAKEFVESVFFGKQFDWAEVGTGTLGAGTIYYF